MVEIDFDKSGGIVPVVAQDYFSGEVLMLAYMNREAWAKTLDTGQAHYWSRSRQKLWKKGETSGNLQEVREVRVDCDGDALLIKIRQAGGAACHQGYRSCFYRVLRGEGFAVEGERIFDPADKYPKEKYREGSTREGEAVRGEGS